MPFSQGPLLDLHACRAKRQQANQRIADGYRAAVEAAWAQSDPLGQESAQNVAQWADQLTTVDPSEMPDSGGPIRDDFSTVADKSNFAQASSIVAKAEQEEAAAKSWADRVEEGQRRADKLQAEIDEMLVTIEKKQGYAERKAEQTSVDDLRAAFELAMLKSQ